MNPQNNNIESLILFHKDVFFKFPALNAEEFISAIKNHPKEVENEKFQWGQLYSSSDKVSLDVDDWAKYLIPNINHFSNLIGADIEWGLYGSWINLYKRGDFQEPHDHATGDGITHLCCVFFANDGKDFAKFFFTDPQHSRLSSLWSDFFKSTGVHVLEQIKAGDILFFPPHLFHGVTIHKSDTIRMTFSANIIIHSHKFKKKSASKALW